MKIKIDNDKSLPVNKVFKKRLTPTLILLMVEKDRKRVPLGEDIARSRGSGGVSPTLRPSTDGNLCVLFHKDPNRTPMSIEIMDIDFGDDWSVLAYHEDDSYIILTLHNDNGYDWEETSIEK